MVVTLRAIKIKQHALLMPRVGMLIEYVLNPPPVLQVLRHSFLALSALFIQSICGFTATLAHIFKVHFHFEVLVVGWVLADGVWVNWIFIENHETIEDE